MIKKTKERSITVQVTDNWRFKIDNYGNHEPIRLNTNLESKAFGEWQPVSKYFANVKQVIQYIANEELFNEFSVEDGVIVDDFDDFLFYVESTYQKLEDSVNRMVEKLK